MLGNGNYLPGFNNALTPMGFFHTHGFWNLHITNLKALHVTKDVTESSALVSDK